jgi:hypothetical protein
MAATFVGSDSGNATSGNISLTLPSVNAGDLAVIFMYTDQDTGTHSISTSGWTNLLDTLTSTGRDMHTSLWYKFVSGSESNPTAQQSGSEEISASVHVFRGVDQTIPPYVTIATDDNIAEPSETDTPADIDTYFDAALGLRIMALTHDDVTSRGTPTGYTDGEGVFGGAADHRQQFVAYDLDLGTAGTKSAPTFDHVLNNNVGEYHTIFLVFEEEQPIQVDTPIDTDDFITSSQQNVVITGAGFESTQGTGVVQLRQNQDYSGNTLTLSVDSWSDTSIQVDFPVSSGWNQGEVFLFVTNDSGDRTWGYPIVFGRNSYQGVLEGIGPDHLWMLNNTYDDEVGANPMTTDVANGGGAFVATPICRSNSHCWEVDNVLDRRGCADSAFMNITTAHQRRTMGGWIQLGTVQKSLASIYKEGGGVNNACFLIGLGNALVAQVADTNDFTVQAYSDFLLATDRPYHIMWQFEGDNYGDHIKLFIDGTEQNRSSGSPGTEHFDTHSGDMNWGDPDSNLEMGGSDVAFAGSEDCQYAAWITFSTNNQPTDSEIYDMFLDGALADDTIDTDSVANMQSDLDALSTSRGDYAVSIEIPAVTGGGDFTLTMTDFDFDDRISVHVNYLGDPGDTLTIRKSGTTNLDIAKFKSATGGSVAVIETAPVKLTVQDISDNSDIQSARVLLLADSGGPLPAEESVSITRSGSTATVTHTAHGMLDGSEVFIQGADQSAYNGIHTITVTGVNSYTYTVSGSPTTPATGTITGTAVIINDSTDVNGEVEAEIDYTSSQPVTGRVRKATSPTRYKPGVVVGTISADGFDGTVLLIPDQ